MNELPPGEAVREFGSHFEKILANVGQLIRGKQPEVRLALVCLFAEGHLLLEDVPGVAKTSLARAIGQSIEATVRRIQFTPDMLPTDVHGTYVYDQRTREFPFRKGPVFANILLGDEMNRASPKTQSALLEAMAEGQVTTVMGETFQLERPFLCIATQNPIDLQGTYALPEAQLDRFAMRISLGYPDLEDEVGIILDGVDRLSPDSLKPVLAKGQLAAMIAVVPQVSVAFEVAEYVASLVQATRPPQNTEVRLGVSPRGGIALARCAQALAASHKRDFVKIDDVKELALPVLAHRIVLEPEAAVRGRTVTQVLEEILGDVPTQRSAHLALR